MDISKYIDEHLDEILENPDFFLENQDFELGLNTKFCPGKINYQNEFESNPNEDDYQDDITSELYQNMYENKQIKLNNNSKTKSNVSFNLENNLTVSNEFIELENNSNELGIEIDKDVQSNLIINPTEPDLELKYYFNLINVFMLYYNEKFEKSDNFFTGIKNISSDTSNPMELFFEAIIEFKDLKNKIYEDIEINNKHDEVLDNEESLNNITMKFIFEESYEEKLQYLFESWKGQIYCLDIKSTKLFSPSLIVCLNYIQNLHLEFGSYNIFNLRNY